MEKSPINHNNTKMDKARTITITVLTNKFYGLGWSLEKAKYWEQNIYNSYLKSNATYEENVSKFIDNAILANKLIVQGANM